MLHIKRQRKEEKKKKRLIFGVVTCSLFLRCGWFFYGMTSTEKRNVEIWKKESEREEEQRTRGEGQRPKAQTREEDKSSTGREERMSLKGQKETDTSTNEKKGSVRRQRMKDWRGLKDKRQWRYERSQSQGSKTEDHPQTLVDILRSPCVQAAASEAFPATERLELLTQRQTSPSCHNVCDFRDESSQNLHQGLWRFNWDRFRVCGYFQRLKINLHLKLKTRFATVA